MIEKWKEVRGYPKYKVSSYGNVLSKPQENNRYRYERMLTAHVTTKGYRQTSLYSKDNPRRVVRIHRLVAEHFIPNPENKKQVNHRDGDKANNRVDNLEWATNEENMAHAVKMGLFKTKKHYKASIKNLEKINKED